MDSEKVADSEKVKAGPGTLTDAEAAGVRRIVVDLVRVEPGIAKAGPGGPMNKEAKKKSEGIAAAKREKHRRKRHVRKKPGGSAGKEGDAGKLADLETPVASQVKPDVGSGPVAKAGNRHAGKLADWVLDCEING